MEQRKLFSKKEWPLFVLFLVVLLVGTVVLYVQPRGATVVVEVNGRVVIRKELDRLAGPEELTVPGENGMEWTIALSPEGAEVVSANCPDKTCRRAGRLTRAGESAVCLPGRMVLHLEGESSTDAETY